ncbi:hypothetical protein U1Q18_033541 [Sarracenia purpurea var. burkii]
MSSLCLLLSRHPLLQLWFIAITTTAIFSTKFSSASRGVSVHQSENGKVTVALYYESLCPYCSNFIVNDLVKLFDDDELISLVDLKIIPYGNARIGPNDTVTCQHGPSECLLNTIEACAINIWPDLNKHFSYINCVETLVYKHKYPQWETCFDELGLDPTPISECYSSGYGKELELKYAAETNTLQPPHEYVPWVVVDGQPLYEDYENFVSYICKAYNGTARPNACTGLALDTIRNEKTNTRHPVSYIESATKSTLSKIRSAIISWMDDGSS